MSAKDTDHKVPEIHAGDPMYHFLKRRGMTFRRLLIILLLVNIGRSIIVPAIHYDLNGGNWLTELNTKDIQSLFLSFVIQPMLLVIYWNTIYVIPRTFQTLYNNGVLTPKHDSISLADFVTRADGILNNRRANIMWLVVVLVVLFGFNMFWPIAGDPKEFPPYGAYPYNWFWQILENPHGFFLYSLGAWATWRCLKFAEVVKELWKCFDLEINMNNPDGAGGLRPIGEFTLQIGFLLSIFILFFAATYLGARSESINVTANVIIMAFVFLLIAPFAFMYPIWDTHQNMVKWRKRHLNALTYQLNTQWRRVYRNLDATSTEGVEKLTALMELHVMSNTSIPVWPFDRKTVTRYSSAIVASFAPLLADFSQILGPGSSA